MVSDRGIKKANGMNSADGIFDIAFFLYMCANLAHQNTADAFDSNFRTYSFLFLAAAVAFRFIGNPKLKLNHGIVTSILFFMYAGLSRLWSIDPTLFGGISGSMIRNIVVFIGLSKRVTDKEELNRVFFVFFCAILYCVIRLLIRTPISEYGAQRIGTALGLNENGLGIRMFFGLTIAIYFLNSSIAQSKPKKYFLYILCIVLIVLNFFTGSRKTAFACIFLMSTSLLGTVSNRKYLFRFFVFIAFLSLAYYIIFSVDEFYNVLGKRIDMLLQYRSGDLSFDSSSYLRSQLAAEAWDIFLQHPILGCGANNFIGYSSYYGYAHNNFLELLSTLGFVGFMIYYAQYVRIAAPLWRFRKTDHQYKVLFYSFVVFVICEVGLVSYYSSVYQVFLNLIYLFGIMREDNEYQLERLNEA